MRRRILAATLAVTAAALLIFGVPLGWSVGHVYRSQELTRPRQAAAAAAAAAAVPAAGVRGSDQIEPPPLPARMPLSYYDLGDALAAGKGAGTAGRAVTGHPSEGSAGSLLVVAVPVTVDETTVGAVEASSPRASLRTRTLRAWLAMVALGALAMAAAGLIAR